MRNLIFILISFVSISAFAKTLVLPSEDMTFDIYKERCQKEGYQCTIPYFIAQIKNEIPAEYESMISNLDLLKPEQVAQIEDSLSHILTNTALDFEQAESLLDLIDKALVLKKSQKLDYLKSILSKSLNLIKIIPEVNEEKWMSSESLYLVYKKVISAENYNKIRSQIAGINVYKITSNYYPQQINIKSQAPTPLLSGSCESPSYSISQEQVLPLFKEECSFANSWSQSSDKVTSFVKEHKTSLIVTGLVIGAAIFLNKYKMEVRF